MTEPVMLPTDEERKQIFYYLQRNTSYTAWLRIYGYYKRWVEILEKNVVYCENHAPPGRLPAVGTDKLIRALQGQSHFEKALERLKEGDKRVFMYNHHGDIEMAGRPLDAWNTTMLRLEWRETIIETEKIPYWDEMVNALNDVLYAWGECGPSFLQTRDPDEPGPLHYGDWLKAELPKIQFPHPLLDVPNPEQDIFANTGQRLPYRGIWEPVQVEWTGGFLGMFQSPVVPEGHRYPLTGCMNYLHAFDKAPKAKIETATTSIDIDVTWRLLWKDERYEDGTIPEEEKDYVFNAPADKEEENASANPDILTQATGEKCRRTGIWVQVKNHDISQIILAGEEMPAWHGTSVSWMWMREE